MRASELAFSSKPKPDEGEPGAAGSCFLPAATGRNSGLDPLTGGWE